MSTPNRNIVLSHPPELDAFDQGKLDNTLNQFYDKMARIAPGETELKIHFKRYEKEGSRQKHVVHASFHYPGNSVRDEEWDWDIHVATRNVLKKLLHNLQRKMHRD